MPRLRGFGGRALRGTSSEAAQARHSGNLSAAGLKDDRLFHIRTQTMVRDSEGNTEAVVVMITTGSHEEGERIAHALLEARLAACVNLLPGVTSLYWWEGKIDRSEEVLLLVKTRRALFPRLVEAVRAVHSYEVFEAIGLPIQVGGDDYLRWIEESTAADQEGK